MQDYDKLTQTFINTYEAVLRLERTAMKSTPLADLSMAEVHTIEAIGTGDPKAMNEIATYLRIKVSSLTVCIDRLVRKGYVRRVRSVEDRRIVFAELTKNGTKACRMHEYFHKNMMRAALGTLTEEQGEALNQALMNLFCFFEKEEKRIKQQKEIIQG